MIRALNTAAGHCRSMNSQTPLARYFYLQIHIPTIMLWSNNDTNIFTQVICIFRIVYLVVKNFILVENCKYLPIPIIPACENRTDRWVDRAGARAYPFACHSILSDMCISFHLFHFPCGSNIRTMLYKINPFMPNIRHPYMCASFLSLRKIPSQNKLNTI